MCFWNLINVCECLRRKTSLLVVINNVLENYQMYEEGYTDAISISWLKHIDGLDSKNKWPDIKLQSSKTVFGLIILVT